MSMSEGYNPVEDADKLRSSDEFRRAFIEDQQRLGDLKETGGQAAGVARRAQERAAVAQMALGKMRGGGGRASRQASNAAAQAFIDGGAAVNVAIDAAKQGYGELEATAAGILAMDDAQFDRAVKTMEAASVRTDKELDQQDSANFWGTMATGMATGAAMGSAGGPWGVAGGAALGALAGGLTYFLEDGGTVPGPEGAGDVVPAMLSPGEVVIPRRLTEELREVINRAAHRGPDEVIRAYDGGGITRAKNSGLSGWYNENLSPEQEGRLLAEEAKLKREQDVKKVRMLAGGPSLSTLLPRGGQTEMFPDKQDDPSTIQGATDGSDRWTARPADMLSLMSPPAGEMPAPAYARRPRFKDYTSRLNAADDAYKDRFDVKKSTEYEGIRSDVETAREGVEKAKEAVDRATIDLKDFKVDPNRAFPTMMSKIMATISVAMGAYAEGLSQGRVKNTALKIMEGAINRDLEAQKAEYAKLKGLVDTKHNLYGRFMQELGDAKAAEIAYKTAAANEYNMQLSRIGAESGLELEQKGLLLQSDEFNALQKNQLAAAALRKKGGGFGKLPKSIQQSLGMTNMMMENIPKIVRLDKEMWGWSPARWASKKVHGSIADTASKKFDREVQALFLDNLRYFSGSQVTKDEHKRLAVLWPKSEEADEVRRAKMLSLLDMAVTRAQFNYSLLSPMQKAQIKAANPMWEVMEMSEPERMRKWSSMLDGESGTYSKGVQAALKDVQTDLAKRGL